jgi:hypothetical protein
VFFVDQSKRRNDWLAAQSQGMIGLIQIFIFHFHKGPDRAKIAFEKEKGLQFASIDQSSAPTFASTSNSAATAAATATNSSSATTTATGSCTAATGQGSITIHQTNVASKEVFLLGSIFS